MAFSNSWLGSLGLTIFGLILLLAGYGVGHYLGLPVLQHAKASTSWPKVSGKITKSEIEHHSKRDNKTHRTKHTYSHHVEFEFQVQDKTYSSKTVWFGDDYSSSSRGTHEEVTHKYPVGKQVDVFYDPQEPSLAVLEPGAKISSYAIYSVGWVLTIVGGILMLGGLRGTLLPRAI